MTSEKTPGSEPLVPAAFELLAQSYVIRVKAGAPIDVVPAIPPTLRPRVEYLLSQ